MLGLAKTIVSAALVASGAWPSVAAAQQVLTQKKLIEYGWDVVNPAYVREHIREMGKLPFDGLIMRMAVGGRVFVKEKWADERVADDFEHLRNIEWGAFTDNFIIMYAASEVDWFNDGDWEAVCHNVGLTAHAAKLGRCKGLCFDAEPYGTNPWSYPTQPHAGDRSFAEYEAQVRKRGAQFMRAITDEMPEVVLHTFFLLGYFGDLWHMEDLAARAEKLSTKHYALYPAFINGMLDAADPDVTITDGNESAYYYQDSLSFFRAYHNIRQSGVAMVAPENTRKYQTQVQASQALYVDHLFNLRTQKYLSAYLEPDERAKWFEHNVYYALTTSDEYVWLYSERMNWWKNESIPPGLEEAVRSAREKVRNHQPLGIDIEPILEAGREREREAVRASLIQRSADIARLPDGTPAPTIDGSLADAAWTAPTTLEPFVPYVRQKDAQVQPTEARVAYDEKGLYVGVRCTEPKTGELKIVGQKRDDDIWMGDSVDIFVQPPDQAPTYYHFIVNPAGTVWDARCGAEDDLSYDPEWDAAVKVSDGEWTLEVAIPWAAMKMSPPQPGSQCRANICRQRSVQREWSTWSQVVGGFVEPDNFGTWTFR